MSTRENRIKLDFSSATDRIEVVDNNSNHSPVSAISTYRVTTELHDKESSNTLASKVNQIVPNLFEPEVGLREGQTIPLEIETSSGSSDVEIVRDGYSLIATVINGSVTLSIPLARGLFKSNRFGEYADLSRALIIVAIYVSGLPFQPAKHEENAFKKLEKYMEANTND